VSERAIVREVAKWGRVGSENVRKTFCARLFFKGTFLVNTTYLFVRRQLVDNFKTFKIRVEDRYVPFSSLAAPFSPTLTSLFPPFACNLFHSFDLKGKI